jgi:hypothetical protein
MADGTAVGWWKGAEFTKDRGTAGTPIGSLQGLAFPAEGCSDGGHQSPEPAAEGRLDAGAGGQCHRRLREYRA